jgi:NAD(P)-dependent dehydrogenase (short-subunit alcohol dehydrogenase family)
MAKNIIITGTSRGIGFEMAKQFSAQGHRVLALSRNDAPINEASLAGCNALSFDIGSTDDTVKVKQFIEAHWNQVDILINNSGFLVNKPFLELTSQDIEQSYKVNVMGVMKLIQTVAPFMRNEGHIVNISSMGGVLGSAKFAGLSAYSSSKGALITLTEVLAEEFKENGPSCNALALGAVQTEMLEEAFPGYVAPISAQKMGAYIVNFALTGHQFYNGKILPVSSSTP